MDKVIAKNRSGWILQEYINIPEEEISDYPNVTGSYAIVKVRGKYLIGYNSWRKQWEFPAGGIEDGETARQAAYRELFEETHQGDLALEFKGLFKVMDSHGKQKYQAVFLGEKECRMKKISLILTVLIYNILNRYLAVNFHPTE